MGERKLRVKAKKCKEVKEEKAGERVVTQRVQGR